MSIIVPVYNVEPYVRECLESIRTQTNGEWEAIVVDDCSTDGSMRVVSDVVASDKRFRVVHLPENAGLGNARNTGFAEATGDYVMFLDSDDYLESYALERIARLIRNDSEPDIVWFDYAREWWWGKRSRNIYGHILGGVGPGPTTIAQHTELLQILPIAPNKAYRREYLDRIEFPFPRGLYEDVPFTYPVLLNAASISIVDEVLYIYRQRRHGNIRRISTAAHFAILDQYEVTFSRIDYPSLSDEIRGVLYRKMLDHLFTVYGMGPGRIPTAGRGDFFHQASALAKRYDTPPDKPPLIGMRRLALLVDNRYFLFRMSMAPAEISTWFDDQRTNWKKRRDFRRKRRKTTVKRWLYRNVLVRGRLDPTLAVISADLGGHPAGNPRAVYDELLRAKPEIRPVWSFSSRVVDDTGAEFPHVVRGSWEYYRTLARATYFVSNDNLPAYFTKRRGTTVLQTLKGTPFQTIYTDTRPYAAVSKGTNLGALLKRADAWDFCMSSSSYATEVIKRAIPSNFEVLEFGQPRNDALLGDVESASQEVRDRFGIDRRALVVLYAPTRRTWERTISSSIDLDGFASSLKSSAVLLTTVPLPGGDERHIPGEGACIIDVSEFRDINLLSAATDILVTDYSSIMFDYALLNRPIVIYADDYQTFTTVRGTYFDLREWPPGAVVTTGKELIRLFDSGDYDTAATRDSLDSFRTRFCEFEDGSASSHVVDRVFR